jgi:pyruvate/2-oxoglutarate dehydrogenase complex dihydrolipoamide dehydrogenase (E3) component
MERMRRVRAQISPNDSARYYRERGVDVFLGHGEFTGPDTVRVGSDTLRFSKAVITTGAGPRTLPLEGLQEAGFLTNQTIFSLSALPRRLAVIGGGPLGCELAQACARLGGEVTILDKSPRLLPREDPDAATLLGETFVGEGIRLKQGIALTRVEKRKGEKRIHFRKDEKEEMLVVDEILLGAGRTPNVHGLGLEKAGIEYDERKGIGVDEHLRTSNRKVYAAGDCCSKYKFSHVAEAQARMVLQNALFLGRRKTSDLIIPWCTYTDPEIAHTGMYEAEAREKGIDVDTFMVNLGDTDRAVADGEEKGFAKIHTKKGSDKILGATTVGRHAGELISELTLAIVAKVGLKTIANTIHPYPTHSEVMRHVADEYNRSRLTPGVQKLFSKWLQWRR